MMLPSFIYGRIAWNRCCEIQVAYSSNEWAVMTMVMVIGHASCLHMILDLNVKNGVNQQTKNADAIEEVKHQTLRF